MEWRLQEPTVGLTYNVRVEVLVFRKFGWLAGITLMAGLVSQVRGVTDFHHTEWNGLGAVFDIKQCPAGFLWLTTSKGVRRFDGVRFQIVEEVTRGAAHDSEIDSVFFSSSGGLWLTTQGAGLLYWKDGRLTAFPDRRCTPTRKQGQIVEDRDGSLWVQAKAGLFRLRGTVCGQVGRNRDIPAVSRPGSSWTVTGRYG